MSQTVKRERVEEIDRSTQHEICVCVFADPIRAFLSTLRCQLNFATGEVIVLIRRHLNFAASTTVADGTVSPTTTYGAGLSPSSYVVC